jgi:hypothetical protein
LRSDDQQRGVTLARVRVLQLHQLEREVGQRGAQALAKDGKVDDGVFAHAAMGLLDLCVHAPYGSSSRRYLRRAG